MVRELIAPVDASVIQRCAAFIEETLESADAPMKAIMQINVATDEILANITMYSGAKCVTVRCDVDEGEIRIEFRDDGLPYDPTKQPEPDVTLSADERNLGGLGIFMVKKMMNVVSYARKDDCNVLTIVKRVG